jgi:penicillin-binding protein 2
MKKVYQTVIVILFGVLLIRLGYLTIIRGDDFLSQAEENRVVKEPIVAPRGTIFDRNGRILAQDRPYCLYQGEEKEREECLKLKSAGETIEQLFRRYYPLGETAAHITGYLGQASWEEVESTTYQSGQLVGRGGVEEYYQDLLAGKDSYRLVEVDINGKKVRDVGELIPQEGQSLTLSIDSKIQQKAADILATLAGAIVVSNPQTGEILALVSSPSFDPNIFTFDYDEEQIVRLLNDSSQPFLNRAISARYPPGSIFKLVAGIAGLEEGVIAGDTEIEDTGFIEINGYKYANWYYTQYGRTDEDVNVVGAIKRSNDIFFYRLGEKLGPDRLSFWAKEFGLDSLTGIDLPAEVTGFVPTAKWKEDVLKENWFLGNSFHFAIGQGYLAVTPIEVNVMTNFFANGGYLCRPYLNLDSQPWCRHLDVDQLNRELIYRGMAAACQTGGTASVFFDFEINGQKNQVACKTGTAEFDAGEEITHAWFTAFSPLDNPVISVTVFLQDGGGGAREAAPLAKEIMTDYFNN